MSQKTKISVIIAVTAIFLSVGNLSAQVNLTRGLAGYWPFDSSGLNQSPNRLPRTDFQLQKGIYYAPGIDGPADAYGALYFNGKENYGRIEHSLHSSQVAFSLWFLADNSGGGALLGWDHKGYDVSLLRSGKLSVYMYVSNSFLYDFIYEKNLADGQWHHVLAQFDGTTFSVYIDGAQVHNKSDYGSGRAVYFESGGFNIGGMPMAADKQYFTGRLDELLIYNRALTKNEIELLAGKVCFTSDDVPDDGLIVYLPFQEDEQNVSPNYVKSTSIEVQRGSFATPCSGSETALGKYMKLLNGADEYLSGREALQLPTFTLCFFLSTTSAEESLVAGWDSAGYQIVLNQRGNIGKLLVRLWVSKKEIYSFATSNALNDGLCHQIALSYDSSFFKVYIDGELAKETGEHGPGRPVFYEGAKFLIGHDATSQSGRWLQGKIDEIRLYNRALPAKDITYLRRSREWPAESIQKQKYPVHGGSGCFAFVGNRSSRQVPVEILDKNTNPPSPVVKKQQLKPGAALLKSFPGAPEDYIIKVDGK